MRSSIFRYPYAKVFRRTQRTLSHWGLKLTSADANTGFIHAETGFSFLRPSMTVDLVIEEMENHDTRVTIKGLTVKKGLFNNKLVDTELSEVNLLENLSARF